MRSPVYTSQVIMAKLYTSTALDSLPSRSSSTGWKAMVPYVLVVTCVPLVSRWLRPRSHSCARPCACLFLIMAAQVLDYADRHSGCLEHMRLRHTGTLDLMTVRMPSEGNMAGYSSKHVKEAAARAGCETGPRLDGEAARVAGGGLQEAVGALEVAVDDAQAVQVLHARRDVDQAAQHAVLRAAHPAHWASQQVHAAHDSPCQCWGSQARCAASCMLCVAGLQCSGCSLRGGCLL